MKWYAQLLLYLEQEAKLQNHRLEKRRGQLLLSSKKELEDVREKLRREAEEEREEQKCVSVPISAQLCQYVYYQYLLVCLCMFSVLVFYDIV